MAKPKSPETPYLTFKYLRNHQISLGDDKQYPIPMTMIEQMTPLGKNATMPSFDMEHEFKVTLKDEVPRLPVRPEGMSMTYFEKICDKAYSRAGEAKEANDKVREAIQHYVDDGTLEVLNDPFASETTLDFDPTLLRDDRPDDFVEEDLTVGDVIPKPARLRSSKKD